MNILFICTGNTCRSPMAEYLFNQKAGKTGHQATSAGLAAWPGEPISDNARTVLMTDYEIDASGHRARKVSENQIEQADTVLTMNLRQRDHLRRLMPGLSGKIRTIGEAADRPDEEIEDPYGYDINAYRVTARQLERLTQHILDSLEKKDETGDDDMVSDPSE